MKRICLIFNHLQHQDGVARSAIAIANWLTRMELAEVTLIPLYTNDKKTYDLLEPSVRVHPVFGFYFRGLSHIVDALPAKWIMKWVIKEEFDIMIGFQYGLSLRCVAASKQRSSVNKYAWIHTYDEGLRYRNEYEAIGKVICVSRCNSVRLHKELPTVFTDYSYNPIDEKQIQHLSENLIDIIVPDDKLLLVSVGRMSPEKGYDRLLRICKRLKDGGLRFELWLIGDGPQYSELQSLNSDLKLNNYVHFLGRQSNPYKYVTKADVFICSSFSEGYSTVCTEAIMLGVPIVTTNVSGAEEIIEDAECGLLVGMDDDSLFNGISKVLQNPMIVEEWKKRLKTTRNRFYAEKRIQRLVNILGLKDE